jgi:hypothetical protein
MIDNTLEALANHWTELADAFHRYAKKFPDITPPPANPADDPRRMLDNPTGPTGLPAGQVGFAQLCFHEPAGTEPLAKRGEAQRVASAKIGTVANATTLADRFKRAANVVARSRVRSIPRLPPGPSDPADAIEADELAHFLGLDSLRTKFDTHFGGRPDTFEKRDCAERLALLEEFIKGFDRDAQELQDPDGITQRSEIRGIRGSVDTLSAYPILTSEVGPVRSTPSSGGGGLGEPYGLRRTVTAAIRDVLGRAPRREDTRSFVAALTRTFEVNEVEGHTEVVWNPTTLAGETELGGGITGGQASLYSRAKFSLRQALPLLEGLYPLKPDPDPELIDSSRNIVRSLLTEVVGELGQEGGPRAARVDRLFDDLFTEELTTVTGVAKKGHLDLLAFELGMEPRHVNTLAEETNFSNFIALRDYVQAVLDGWKGFRDSPDGKDLGTRLVRLSRALSVAAESVDEVTDAMDSVFVGEAERQVASFRDPAGRRVQVGETLAWVRDFTAREAPRVVIEGGRRGVGAIVPTANRLAELIEQLVRTMVSEPDIPVGMRQARVRNPLSELAAHLRRIERLAKDVQLNA